MQFREALYLRIKDVVFGRKVYIVIQGKGGKDRIVMLPDLGNITLSTLQ